MIFFKSVKICKNYDHGSVGPLFGRPWFLRVRGPVWARWRCRISPPRFLAECCKRQLNQGSFVLLYFRLLSFSDLYWVCLSVFSCTVLFVSIGQVIGCEDRLRNDLYCVEWGVKLYSNQTCEFEWNKRRVISQTAVAGHSSLCISKRRRSRRQRDAVVQRSTRWSELAAEMVVGDLHSAASTSPGAARRPTSTSWSPAPPARDLVTECRVCLSGHHRLSAICWVHAADRRTIDEYLLLSRYHNARNVVVVVVVYRN